MMNNKPLFGLGSVVITSNAKETVNPSDVVLALVRHQKGDWGNLCSDDKKENALALRNGLRLLSSYSDACGVKFWIITEADRSVTTIMLPEDY